MYLSPNERRYIMIREHGSIDGDVRLSWWKRRRLKRDQGVWMIDPISRTNLLVKSLEDKIYIVDEVAYRPNVLEALAIEIGEELVSRGRINVTTAQNIYGNVRVDVNFGIPNLLWLLYPRGSLDIVRAPKALRIISTLTRPIFFIVDLVVKAWQHRIYRQVYQRTFSMFPQYTKELYTGMSYPEIGM